MAHRSEQAAIYTCDACGLIVELDGMVGGSLGGPAGWRTIQPQTTSNGDWFCSWECLARFATLHAEAKVKRMEALAMTQASAEQQAETT